MPTYELVGGPLNGARYELPEYRLGQGFELNRPQGSEHLDGATYTLQEDGKLHYLKPEEDRRRVIE